MRVNVKDLTETDLVFATEASSLGIKPGEPWPEEIILDEHGREFTYTRLGSLVLNGVLEYGEYVCGTIRKHIRVFND
jgi:hypothetical protein